MKLKGECSLGEGKVGIAETIAQKSRLTKEDVNELDKLVKEGIAKSHGLEFDEKK
ncbi:MAG: hypothetical protein KJ600_05855 [Nanoarchaeota archaeon]|nr:hypothetical protein [Nanoarchaeota archaeon]MBU1104053.1 hypothetical protein [Nanoarchaeota archaeon]